MRQLLQSLKDGSIRIEEVPRPHVGANRILVETCKTVVSAGTERMLLDFGKGGWIAKVRQQPDKVRMVLEKAKTDGIIATAESVKSKLEQPIPLGYCNVGVVATVGTGVNAFEVGDRVVSNGSHSEVVVVSQNLCAKVPDKVSDDQASFTVLGAIGLQGIRLVNPSIGETVVVIGLGLIGLLTVQMLLANGCRVIGIDLDKRRIKLAEELGAKVVNPAAGEDPIAVAKSFTKGRGVDAVLITASTQSSKPVADAAEMCRKRGRIVLVGVTGLELNRSDFYEKELTFQVSCSYGPGRYDPSYEEDGQDYPIGFVRWTEQRNLEAVLDMMASGKLNVEPLITHRYAFENAKEAYDALGADKTALGILLEYNRPSEERTVKTVTLNKESTYDPKEPTIGFVGAGNYASRVLIPAFKAANGQLQSIATSGGVNGVIHGAKAGFRETTTDTEGLILSDLINTVAIVTRHNTHAHFVSKAVAAGKHVFVEKPLAINFEELELVQKSLQMTENSPLLMVGFNRRFARQVQKMKSLVMPLREPKTLILTMNAGAIPSDHWTQDIETGGGRIIGEACHFIDLARFLVDSPIISVQARKMGDTDNGEVTEDKASITLGFEDGSLATIHYFANGANSFPKERIEVFAAGRVLQLDNFRKLRGYGWPGFKKMNLWRQDKGQKACVQAFLDAIRNGNPSPISPEELFEVARVTIEATEQLRSQK
ncbi:bi-domain-containing oxidoreductase [Pseudidiomarina terrestris]|uniref:bi-domain-containing oxidoreductase n=1 Tax=Pseudidiomarina terrestris TaxID=2820060 RepID=UPI00264CD85B|nr:bi-domain-containing oxidoreductase [Pseudidiomarina sp. 1ASP75-5]MDN7134543.1 bi-domain-containing oxidoreductase [Pseudidiomarina sp. 1ASP75-5]